MSINIVGVENFNEVVRGNDKPVLVDFYADWCGPCKMLSPIIEEIAEEKKDEIAVYKINVDESPELAQEFSVMSIPTVISFKNGEVYKRVVGLQSKQGILELVD